MEESGLCLPSIPKEVMNRLFPTYLSILDVVWNRMASSFYLSWKLYGAEWPQSPQYPGSTVEQRGLNLLSIQEVVWNSVFSTSLVSRR